MKIKKLLLKILYGNPKVLKFANKEFFLYCDDFNYAKVYTVYNNNLIDLGYLNLKPTNGYFTKKEFDSYLQKKILTSYKDYEREMKTQKILEEFWEEG